MSETISNIKVGGTTYAINDSTKAGLEEISALTNVAQNNTELLNSAQTKLDELLLKVEGSGIDTSDATATSNDILSGFTAYVNGVKVVGTLDLSNLLPENIISGVVINGVAGSHICDSDLNNYDYDILIASGFNGSDLTNPVNGSYDCSILNGTWNRITTTDDATLQANGFKSEQWQHADHGFILKYVSNQNRWEIHSNDTYIAFEAGACANQLTPWDEIYSGGYLATMWAGLIALPLNGKFYLKSTTEQEGFGAKYQIVGCPNDDYNGYYKLSDEKSFNNNPVYVNTKTSDNPTKMIIGDEVMVPVVFLGSGSYSGLFNSIYRYGEYGGYESIQSNAENWQLAGDGTTVSGMKCIVL